MDEIKLSTPEQIELSYELAGLGSRFLAIFLDTLIQLGAVLCFGLIALPVGLIFRNFGPASWMEILAISISVIAVFLIFWAYFIFFETLWSGRTPGKKILKLRVLKEGGQPISFFDALLRNLIRFVDFLPFYYCTGILVMIFSPRNKRLGDWVAGTIVVREAQAAPSPLPLREPVGNAEFVPISEQEYQVIRRFLSRRNEIQPQDRAEICTRIAVPILSRAAIEGQDNDMESFLETIAGQYRETHKSL